MAPSLLLDSRIARIAGLTPVRFFFTYDAVGNRKLMTDGTGSTTYAYDQLSRMTSETRNINGVGYTIGYGYNLANELTSVTDPFSCDGTLLPYFTPATYSYCTKMLQSYRLTTRDGPIRGDTPIIWVAGDPSVELRWL